MTDSDSRVSVDIMKSKLKVNEKETSKVTFINGRIIMNLV